MAIPGISKEFYADHPGGGERPARRISRRRKLTLQTATLTLAGTFGLVVSSTHTDTVATEPVFTGAASIKRHVDAQHTPELIAYQQRMQTKEQIGNFVLNATKTCGLFPVFWGTVYYDFATADGKERRGVYNPILLNNTDMQGMVSQDSRETFAIVGTDPIAQDRPAVHLWREATNYDFDPHESLVGEDISAVRLHRVVCASEATDTNGLQFALLDGTRVGEPLVIS